MSKQSQSLDPKYQKSSQQLAVGEIKRKKTRKAAAPKAVVKTPEQLELEKLKEQLRRLELENKQLKQQQAEIAEREKETKRILEEPHQFAAPAAAWVSSSSGSSSVVGSPVSFMPPPKSAVKAVDAKELSNLLQLVAEGEQDQAEAMLKGSWGFLGLGASKGKPELLLEYGEVTDLSGRTFQSITAFQYALWAMDYHMWTMIRKYLPLEQQLEQFNDLEAKGTAHGKHYDIKPLTSALQTYVDGYRGWSDHQCKDHWCKVVGGAQKLIPAHVVNEYCRKDRPFEPCPEEWESKLPRTREVEVWDSAQSKIVKGSWFVAPPAEDVLGSNFAFLRYSSGVKIEIEPLLGQQGFVLGRGEFRRDSDLKALLSLWKVRVQQWEALKTELAPKLAQSQAFGFK